MPLRSDREILVLPHERYHDDEDDADIEASLNAHQTRHNGNGSNGSADPSQDDALSFMRIDDHEVGSSGGGVNDAAHRRRDYITLPWQVQQTMRSVRARTEVWWRKTVKWTKGPQPPRPWRITPVLAEYQALPITLRDHYFPKQSQRIWLLVAFYGCWLLTFCLVLRRSAFATSIEGHGPPHMVNCAARFWGRGNSCGRDGDDCRPFDKLEFPFRCPASCSKTKLGEPYNVGSSDVNYRPLVIGGPMSDSEDGWANAVYRGDSFICSSAIHSGFMKDQDGGCGVVKLVGERSNYPSVKRHGILSIAFDSYFPQSYVFMKGTSSQCRDLRWSLLGVSATYSAVLSLFTTSPSVFFWSIFTGLFAHVALVSDPPGNSDYKGLISTAVGRFLPAAFCGAVMYLVAVRYTLRDMKAQFEKTILWLGACWVGSLNNYTFDKIPIQRLTPHDLQQQPGAVTALLIIISTILSIALSQAWFIRIEGLMPKYLLVYGIFVGSLLLMLMIPDLKIRIHHYIIGLLFIPGTRLQMRPSMLYQGLLIGFFINGIARWGFDSLLQTELELRGDAPLFSALPTIMPPVIQIEPDTTTPANITFEWIFPKDENQPQSDPYDGISVLVNGVERFKKYRDEGIDKWTWRRRHQGLPEYFRFAYMRGGVTEDYTKAGTWTANGGWIPMEAGHGG